ncbi:hypothetical protein L905_02880 [Agrobacterium sp. TS43]|nr:hypothetical protein L902_35610 [Agrobacterium radiobacter DSM 30147]KVK52507.1 hypothetical protein L903_03935 [Agrobacterium sp. JL28]KVK52897.1 hypothetical protein L904_00965 [Agrobacterium sp. LY4]KVK64848.1 hypothetical protein L906_03915 [Agrobacterium sp. TS45]KVK69078.1 hypothetical protein L907_03915 [Agrobacterium sp. C13]KVK69632.1 hypothetical protein L905_02880 [Agrobacterium sp. TS43]
MEHADRKPDAPPFWQPRCKTLHAFAETAVNSKNENPRRRTGAGFK